MSDTQKHTKPNVPNLRFPGFDGEWKLKRIDDISPLQRGFDLPSQSLHFGTIPVVYSNGIMNYHNESKCVAPGIVTGRSGTIGHLTYIESGPYWPHNTSLWVTNFKGNIPLFVYYLLEHIDLSKFSSGSGVPTLNRNDVHSFKTGIPTIEEQAMIAKCLSDIDKRISIQNKVIEDLSRLKTALCELLYDESIPNYRLGDIIEQKSIRNRIDGELKVLSVNNRYGFIEQSKQFEDRAVASEDTSNYKIVSKNDFAYNPARINVGSIARLKSIDRGIVSPMYICFHCKDIVSPEYLEPFFCTKYFSLEMEKRLEGSVRMCLSFEGLCNIPIHIPSYEKQMNIGNKILVLNDKLRIEEYYSNLLSAQKQYLLSQLFI